MSPNNDTEGKRIAMAQRLREAREYVGLSQEDVAQALNLSRPAITNIESGSRRVEAIELDKLATLYRQTVTYLLTGDEPIGSAPEQFAFLARAVRGLSEKDLEEVARFAAFLKRSPESLHSRRSAKK